jgi:hypothetical protein
LLQPYVWQDYDMFPNFPALKDFLAFWEAKLEGPLFAVAVAHSKLGLPNYAPWTEFSGCINARARSFGVISVAHAQMAGNLLSSRGPIQRYHNPAFSGADEVIE